MKREEIVEEARTYIGVPWRHQGRTRENGLDCIGLPALVGETFKEWKPLPVNYPRRPDGTFVKQFKQYLNIKKMDEQQDGDILVFAESGFPCHCGIRTTYYGQPGVIHSHAGVKKVLEQTLESAYSIMGKPTHVFSFPGVED